MNFNRIWDMGRLADDEGIIFFYNGYFSHKVLLALGETIKNKFNSKDMDRSISRKIFSIFVEQVQNIIRYSDDNLTNLDAQEEIRAGMIVIGLDPGNNKYFVSFGNYISHENAEKLSVKLEEIQQMDKETLKKAYKKKMLEGPDEESKGAGLGFLEIAKSATEPIEFEFKEDSEQKSFFLFRAYI